MNAALLRIGYASMGPPSEKGGIRGRYGYVNNSASGFNGAALREGRNQPGFFYLSFQRLANRVARGPRIGPERLQSDIANIQKTLGFRHKTLGRSTSLLAWYSDYHTSPFLNPGDAPEPFQTPACPSANRAEIGNHDAVLGLVHDSPKGLYHEDPFDGRKVAGENGVLKGVTITEKRSMHSPEALVVGYVVCHQISLAHFATCSSGSEWRIMWDFAH